MIRVYLGWL